jgi:hypothetical protein
MANAHQQALNLIGREKGPDFVLKIEDNLITVPPPGNTNVEDVISSDSGISEVLNIIAFLVNPAANRVAATIDTTKSIPINTAGTQHDANFDVNGGGNLQADNAGSLFTTTPAHNHPFVNLNTFGVALTGVAKNQKIPQGILKRRGGDATPGYNFDGGVDHANRILTGVAAGGGAALDQHTLDLMSRCVKQMINILIKVRDIFGPQGWTSLFNQIKTGGANKNHIKRTHRQHRRRYSSKQY